MSLQVGQKLWFVPSDRYRGDPCEVEVVRIGRKWAHLSNRDRMDIKTLWIDSGGFGSSPGRCYLSREHHEERVRTDKVWRRFAKAIEWYRLPEGVTVENIWDAAELLRIELPLDGGET